MLDAYPVVLLHGFPLDAAMWQSQSKLLRSQGYRVYTPEFPGFGTQPAWPPERYSIEAFADEVAGVIEALPGSAAVVGGFSMGGYVLLSLLRRRPELVRGAMLLNTRARADSPEARAAREAMAAEVLADGTSAIAAPMAARLLRPHADAAVHQRVQTIIQRQSVAGVAGALRAMARRADQADFLPAIKVPTLIIAGQQDQTTPLQFAEALHEGIPGSRLVVVDAGHAAPIEQGAAVGEAMLEFLKGAAATAS